MLFPSLLVSSSWSSCLRAGSAPALRGGAVSASLLRAPAPLASLGRPVFHLRRNESAAPPAVPSPFAPAVGLSHSHLLHTSAWGLDKKEDPDSSSSSSETKVSIVTRFKQMFKDYWYILVPVHCFTSVFWFGGFYIMCKSGLDEWCGTSPQYLEKIQQSNYAYYALAYACYKVATPARYTVTVGGTTLSIKYLSEWGYLRSTSQIASDMKHKRDEMKERAEDGWENLKSKREERAKKRKKE